MSETSNQFSFTRAASTNQRDAKRILLSVSVSLLFVLTMTWASNLQATELHIGTATADITPALPVALMGQFELRIAQTAETPLTANVLALESRDGNRSLETAILVSCDLVGIPKKLLEKLREAVHEQIPQLDVSKVLLNATHTHTAPVLENGLDYSFRYQIPKEHVLQPEQYQAVFVQRVTAAIVKAWHNRQPGSVTWGLSHAAVAYNRRVVYSKEISTPGVFADGVARMYGKTSVPEFSNLEGMEDHDVNLLVFWDSGANVVAMAIDVPCPAQTVEGRSSVNADYWHPVREKLRERFGRDLCVLGWIGAAGDQSPRPLYRSAAEERMISLRHLTGLEEIARRIVLAVEEAYETVKNDRRTEVQFVHKVETLSLPMAWVTEKEYAFAKAERDRYSAQMAANPKAADQVLAHVTWSDDVVKRFEKQKTDPHPQTEVEVHALRLGDVAICSNPFELFTDYGIRIQARSKALQTFVVQLAGDGPYLPTEKAVKGGGYSAIVQSISTGPEGGQLLVDRTVEWINSLWSETK
jgi:hypothetical protein